MVVSSGREDTHKVDARQINTRLLAALGFNLAAWFAIGFVAWMFVN